jgi:hypothetical protein
VQHNYVRALDLFSVVYVNSLEGEPWHSSKAVAFAL